MGSDAEACERLTSSARRHLVRLEYMSLISAYRKGCHIDDVGVRDFEQRLQLLSELAIGELSLTDTLTRVAEYAVAAIPGSEGAGLTFIGEDGSETMVATTDLVAAVDAVQYRLREGPCITAAADERTVRSHTLGQDDRWPVFGSEVAASLGVHSALSLPLIASRRVLGAMNIYARKPYGFNDLAVELGEQFAESAAKALQNVRVVAPTQTLAAQLQDALKHRATIDQAIGVLIASSNCTPEEALKRLGAISSMNGVQLGQIASVVVQQAIDHRLGPHGVT